MKISVDTKQLNKHIAWIEKQTRFAGALAATNTAKIVREGLKDEMRDSFDRPTPFTINAFYIRAAKKADKIPTAKVEIKDSPSRYYLKAQIHGGSRYRKRTEHLLTNAGILPRGQYVVPGRGVRLNKYGNMTRGQIQRMLSNLNAQHDKHANTTDESKRKFFVSTNSGSTRGFHAGIWERSPAGRKIKPFLMFVKKPTYEAGYFDFFYASEQIANDNIKIEFKKAFKHAIKTAR
ncbi:hypothetical protein KAU11_03445 [Candidatus Babeliales bacterium]|nr:hypothetical protein [Candidatus Babeliales bacterium]